MKLIVRPRMLKQYLEHSNYLLTISYYCHHQFTCLLTISLTKTLGP